jgi:hypothetical protein
MNIHKSQLFWCEQKGYYWFWPIPIWKNHMKNPKISEDCKQYQTIRFFFPSMEPWTKFQQDDPVEMSGPKGGRNFVSCYILHIIMISLYIYNYVISYIVYHMCIYIYIVHIKYIISYVYIYTGWWF